MPGAALPFCSEEFLNEYEKADLVIAKGQGNYEALSDEKKNIFFLLKIKCPIIARDFHGQFKLGDIVVLSTSGLRDDIMERKEQQIQ
jgi:hypothetical protein